MCDHNLNDANNRDKKQLLYEHDFIPLWIQRIMYAYIWTFLSRGIYWLTKRYFFYFVLKLYGKLRPLSKYFSLNNKFYLLIFYKKIDYFVDFTKDNDIAQLSQFKNIYNDKIILHCTIKENNKKIKNIITRMKYINSYD